MQLPVIIVLMIIYIEILIFTRLFKFYTTLLGQIARNVVSLHPAPPCIKR